VCSSKTLWLLAHPQEESANCSGYEPADRELSKALGMAGMRIVSGNLSPSQTAVSSFDKGLTLIQREGSAVYSQASDISDRLYLFSASHMTQASPVIDR
jgi:hypothetical protein